MLHSQEQYLATCEQKLYRWSSTLLHVTAAAALTILLAAPGFPGISHETALQYAVFVVIAAGMFSFTCGLLYRRLQSNTQSVIPAEETIVSCSSTKI